MRILATLYYHTTGTDCQHNVNFIKTLQNLTLTDSDPALLCCGYSLVHIILVAIHSKYSEIKQVL